MSGGGEKEKEKQRCTGTEGILVESIVRRVWTFLEEVSTRVQTSKCLHVEAHASTDRHSMLYEATGLPTTTQRQTTQRPLVAATTLGKTIAH